MNLKDNKYWENLSEQKLADELNALGNKIYKSDYDITEEDLRILLYLEHTCIKNKYSYISVNDEFKRLMKTITRNY